MLPLVGEVNEFDFYFSLGLKPSTGLLMEATFMFILNLGIVFAIQLKHFARFLQFAGQGALVPWSLTHYTFI